MIYRGPSFPAVVWFGSSPTALTPHPPVSKLSLFLSLPVCRRSSLLKGEAGGRGGRGAESYDRENLALYLLFNTLISCPMKKYRIGPSLGTQSKLVSFSLKGKPKVKDICLNAHECTRRGKIVFGRRPFFLPVVLFSPTPSPPISTDTATLLPHSLSCSFFSFAIFVCLYQLAGGQGWTRIKRQLKSVVLFL